MWNHFYLLRRVKMLQRGLLGHPRGPFHMPMGHSTCRSVLGQDTEPLNCPLEKVLQIDTLYECVCEWVDDKKRYGEAFQTNSFIQFIKTRKAETRSFTRPLLSIKYSWCWWESELSIWREWWNIRTVFRGNFRKLGPHCFRSLSFTHAQHSRGFPAETLSQQQQILCRIQRGRGSGGGPADRGRM